MIECLHMKDNQKVIMLHGWTNGDISDIPEFLPDNPANWMGWMKQELEKIGYKVFTPFIRYGYKSKYEDWKKEIEKFDIDENTILVGWSSGGAFWVRWLGETKQRVKKLLLVAPAKVVGNSKMNKALGINPDQRSQWDEFHNFITDPTIPDRVDDIIIFISNDADWLVEAANVYTKELRATLIHIPNQRHFTNDVRQSTEFPELLKYFK